MMIDGMMMTDDDDDNADRVHREDEEEVKEEEEGLPSMVPHLVLRPSSLRPFTWYSWSLPTTANGIISCKYTQFNVNHT